MAARSGDGDDMNNLESAFKDRRDAGQQLALRLHHLRHTEPVILGLPRGGVPVAFEVAKLLHAELDVLLVRKIGAPGHPEYGVGAIVDGANPRLVLNEEIVKMTGTTPEYIRATTQSELAELERRRKLYRGIAPAPDLNGRTVIVVDDGIATGNTVKAALQGLALNKPGHLVLAVPVSPPASLKELGKECDEIVCLHSPEHFYAVGAHYLDFAQTSDEEVIRLLGEAMDFTADAHVEPL